MPHSIIMCVMLGKCLKKKCIVNLPGAWGMRVPRVITISQSQYLEATAPNCKLEGTTSRPFKYCCFFAYARARMHHTHTHKRAHRHTHRMAELPALALSGTMLPLMSPIYEPVVFSCCVQVSSPVPLHQRQLPWRLPRCPYSKAY